MGQCMCFHSDIDRDEHQEPVEKFASAAKGQRATLPSPEDVPAAAADELVSKPKQTLDNGIVYEGQWLGDKRHGKGTQVWPSYCLPSGHVNNPRPSFLSIT
eukprot:GDKI01049844.1.p1 GENE.GDKI01049844.1~~GDKI01049844.1.p1  ORF type:complete len:101 (+),score=4.87 GDKI01049844.1:141-443(+)